MELYRAGDRPTTYGPQAYFMGHVTQELINSAPQPARIRALIVTFAPGARTAWHTHPLGQTLHVTSGVGRYQTWGERIVEIRAGDSVWIPPGEKHWHGAAPDQQMVHLAIQEALDGQAAEWMEHVSDQDYTAAP